MAMASTAEPAAASQTSRDPDLRNIFSLFPFNGRPGFAAESSIEPSRHPDCQDPNPANNAASSNLFNGEKRTKTFSWDDIGRKSRKAKDDGILQRRINQIEQEEITKSFEINANDKSKVTTAETVSGSIHAFRPLEEEGAKNRDQNSPEWQIVYEENFSSNRTPQRETKLERRNRLRREKRRSRRQQGERPRRPSLTVQLPLPHDLRGLANAPLLEDEPKGSDKISSQWLEGELLDNEAPPRLSKSSDSGISIDHSETMDRQSSAGLSPLKITKLRLSSSCLASWSRMASEADARQNKVETVLLNNKGDNPLKHTGDSVVAEPLDSSARRPATLRQEAVVIDPTPFDISPMPLKKTPIPQRLNNGHLRNSTQASIQPPPSAPVSQPNTSKSSHNESLSVDVVLDSSTMKLTANGLRIGPGRKEGDNLPEFQEIEGLIAEALLQETVHQSRDVSTSLSRASAPAATGAQSRMPSPSPSESGSCNGSRRSNSRRSRPAHEVVTKRSTAMGTGLGARVQDLWVEGAGPPSAPKRAPQARAAMRPPSRPTSSHRSSTSMRPQTLSTFSTDGDSPLLLDAMAHAVSIFIPDGDIEGTALSDQYHANPSSGGEATATTLAAVTKTIPEDNSDAPKTADVPRVIEVITLEDSDNEATASRAQVASKKSMPKSPQGLEQSRPNTSAPSPINLTEEKSNCSSPTMFESPLTSSVMGSIPAQNSPSAVPMRSPQIPAADLSRQSGRQLSVASALSPTEEMPNPPNWEAAAPWESPAMHGHPVPPKRVAHPSQQTGSQLSVASNLSPTEEMSKTPNSLVSALRDPPAKHGHPSPSNPAPKPSQHSMAPTLTPTGEIANSLNAGASAGSSATHGHLSLHVGIAPPRSTHLSCSWTIAPRRSRAGSAGVAKKVTDLQSRCLVPKCKRSFDSFQELRRHLMDESLHNRRRFTLSHSEGGCRIGVSRVGSTEEAPLILETRDGRTTSASDDAIPRRADRAPPRDVSILMLGAAVRGYPPLSTAHSITNALSTTLGPVITNPLQAIPTLNEIPAIGNMNEQLTAGDRASTLATPIANEMSSNIDQVRSHRAASSASIEGQRATSAAPVKSATGDPSVDTVARPESRQVTPAERASAVIERNRVTSSTPLPLSTPSLPFSSQPTGARSAASTVSGKEPPAVDTYYWWIFNEKGERAVKQWKNAQCDICSATFSDFRNLRNHLKTKDSHADRSIKITYCEKNNYVISVKLPLIGEPPFGTKVFVEDYQNFERAWGWLTKPGEQSSSVPSTPVMADAPNFSIQQLPQLLHQTSAAPYPTSEALTQVSQRSVPVHPNDCGVNLVYWDLDGDLRAKSSSKNFYKTYICIVCNKNTFRTWEALQRHLTKDKEHEGHTVICGDSRQRAKHSVTLRKALSTQSAPKAKAAHIPPASTKAESARFEDDSIPPITSARSLSPLLPQALVKFGETVATESNAREDISSALRRSLTAPRDLPGPQPANEEHPAAAPTTAAQHISDVVMSSQGPEFINDALAKMNTVSRPPPLRTKKNANSLNTDTHDDTDVEVVSTAAQIGRQPLLARTDNQQCGSSNHVLTAAPSHSATATELEPSFELADNMRVKHPVSPNYKRPSFPKPPHPKRTWNDSIKHDTMTRLPLDTHEPIALLPQDNSATIQHIDLTHHNKEFRDDDKDFMVFWDHYILGKSGRDAIHSRMPKILKDFVLAKWVWLHERPSRVPCFLKQITALMAADKITPEVGREIETLLRPQPVPQEAWNRVEGDCLWTRKALKQNMNSWAALWDSLRWQAERRNGAAMTLKMHQTLDQFINVAGHLLVNRDQKSMNKTILTVLRIMVDAPDRDIDTYGVPIKYGDLNALDVVQLLHSFGKREAKGEWRRYLQARTTIDRDIDADGERQDTENRMKALLLNHSQQFTGHEGCRWRRYHEVELHLLYLADSLPLKGLLRQLDNLRTLGTTTDPEAHPNPHPRVQETPLIEPASLPNVPAEERRLPTQKAVKVRGIEECKCGVDIVEWNVAYCANRTSRIHRCPHPAYHRLCVDVGQAFKDGRISEEVWFCEECRKQGWDRPEFSDADDGAYKQDDDDNDAHGPSYATSTNASKGSTSSRIHDNSGQQRDKSPNPQPRKKSKMTSMEEAQLVTRRILTNDASSDSSSSQAVANMPHFSAGTPAERHGMPSPNRPEISSAKRPTKEVLGPGSIFKRPRLNMRTSRADSIESRVNSFESCVFIFDTNMSNAKEDGKPCFQCGKTKTRKHWDGEFSGAGRIDEGKLWCDMCYERDFFNAQAVPVVAGAEDARLAAAVVANSTNIGSPWSTPKVLASPDVSSAAGAQDARPDAAVVAVPTNIGSPWSAPNVLASSDAPFARSIRVKKDGGPCRKCNRTRSGFWYKKLSMEDRPGDGKVWCKNCYNHDWLKKDTARKKAQIGGAGCSIANGNPPPGTELAKERDTVRVQTDAAHYRYFELQDEDASENDEDARPAAAVAAAAVVANPTNIGPPMNTSNLLTQPNISFAESGRAEKDGGPCFNCKRTQSRNWVRRLNEDDPPGDGTVWCHNCYSLDLNKKIRARKKAEATGLAGERDNVKAQMDAAQDRYFELRDYDAPDDVVDAQNRVVMELRTRYKQLKAEVNETMGRGR